MFIRRALIHDLVTREPVTQQVRTADPGCQWWNLACQGGTEIANAGLSAITRSTAAGAQILLGQIVKIVDESTQVPLADPVYREIYYGFLGLAAPLIGVILCAALIVASLKRDPATLGRAVVGLVVAALGGALYIGFAQLMVALDNWLSHGIVRVTGQDLAESMTTMAGGFEAVAGGEGQIAANMLLIILMFIMLLAGLILWFVLVLRKIAILVVVAFAPLLIAGYLWAPTRPWVRKATEVLIALIFTKSAIYAIFGIGLSLLANTSSQSLSTFVGTVVLLCGACFTPLLMLKLVHFAGDTHLAGEMMGNLRGGVQPVLNHVPHGGGGHAPSGRTDMARAQSQAPGPNEGGPEPARATSLSATGPPSEGAGAGTGFAPTGTSASAGSAVSVGDGAGVSAKAGTAAGSGAAAAGPVGLAAAGVMATGQAAASAARTVGSQAAEAGETFAGDTAAPPRQEGAALSGPAQARPEPPSITDESGEN